MLSAFLAQQVHVDFPERWPMMRVIDFFALACENVEQTA